MERGCLGAVGIGIMLFSGFFVAAALGDILSGGDGKTSMGVLVGLLVFFGGLFLVGAYLAWRMFLSPRARAAGRSGADGSSGPATGSPAPPCPAPPSDADRERQILRFAEAEKGRVTVPEVATHCDMTLAEAKAALDRLVLQQAASIQVTRAGVLVYVFPGFLSDEDKASATDF
jgi:hypothetical protein